MPSKTEPPPPATGHSNPGCYASALDDCSAKLSAEHFLSRTILKQLADHGNMLLVGGLHVSPDALRQISVSNLKAKVLCARHNSSLGVLDADASQLFADLLAVTHHNAMVRNSYCGENIERWVLKLMIGALSSGLIGNTTRQRTKIRPARWMLDILFGRREFNSGAGLGVFHSDDYPSHPVVITINTAEEPPFIYGIRVSLFGVNFHLMLSKTARDVCGQYFHRPSELVMPNGSVLTFNWLPGKAGQRLALEPAPTPPDAQ